MAKKILRLGGYVAFSFLSLLIGFYLTFPGEAVGQRLAYELNHRTGGKVSGSFGDVSLYWLTGIEAEDVRLLVKSTDPPTPVTLDSAQVRLQLLPLLWLDLTVAVAAQLRGGTVMAEITPESNGGLALDVEIDELNLVKPPLLPSLAGLSIDGVVNGEGSVRWSADPRKSSGKVSLALAGLGVGPGEPVKGFSLPNRIGFGGLKLGLTLEGGQLRVEQFEQAAGPNPDVAISIANVTANLRRSLATTSYDACLALKLDDGFLAQNKKFEAILDLAKVPAPVGPGFREDSDGYLHASFSGTFSGKPKPRRRLCTEPAEQPRDRNKRVRERKPRGGRR